MFQPQFPVEAAVPRELHGGSWRTRERTCPLPRGSFSSFEYTLDSKCRSPSARNLGDGTPRLLYTDHTHTSHNARLCNPALSAGFLGDAFGQRRSGMSDDQHMSAAPPQFTLPTAGRSTN